MSELPLPAADARAHCERVAAHIRAMIVQAGGWISFARYMELALYSPGLGYYAAGATKLGAMGDFTTAPEMTPLFGAAVARQMAAILAVTEDQQIVELGAGTGRLAATLLAGLEVSASLPSRYLILEPSPDLRERQCATLTAEVPHTVGLVEWIDTLPPHIDGAIIANEVLDAIPAHVLRRNNDAWLERGVSIVGAATPPQYGLAWADRPASPRLKGLAQARFPQTHDYVSEINPAAEALVEHLSRRLRHGAALLIDYGFAAREYYHVQRATGTLMCHYRHRAHDDPFFYPGLGDITAHVDFTAMALAGQRAGLQVAGFTAQAPFLLGCGILEGLAAVGAPESVPYMKAASKVQTLLSPAEMGELFKVLALSRSPGIEWPGFALSDRSHRL